VSGAGMLDFESCQSIEKLVIDNEVCGMARRMISGVTVREIPIALPLLEDLTDADSLLTHPHTMRWYKDEHHLPSAVVDRAKGSEGTVSGSKEAWQRAGEMARRILREHRPDPISPDISAELLRIMGAEAARYGIDRLPEAWDDQASSK
jgi:trimethylamine--corrinoid protein Co-methyltransferase